MAVQIGRTICVMLLAMAIAMLPLSVGFATAAPAPADVSLLQPMPDCDHHQHQHGAPSGQTQKDLDHATCPAGCTFCFVVVATNVPSITYSVPISTALKPLRAGTALSSLMGSPPFRPPRA